MAARAVTASSFKRTKIQEAPAGIDPAATSAGVLGSCWWRMVPWARPAARMNVPAMDSHRSQDALIRGVRERRLADGLRCPHCDSEEVIRWGHFSGRQRYRCRSCRRCFSDLTATVLANRKRLDAWPAYFRSLGRSETVRTAARTADVAASTAFRWRHLILSAIRETDRTTFAGMVEFAQTYLRYSAKGPRRRDPDDEWRENKYVSPDWPFVLPGWVLVVVRDRNGNSGAELIATRTVTGDQLVLAFDAVLSGDATLLCNSGRLGPYGRLIGTPAGRNRRVVRVPNGGRPGYDPHHNNSARSWIVGFKAWLVPFRGVATRYVTNYAAWRRMIDVLEAGPWFCALFPVGCGSGPPTAPENTDGRRADDDIGPAPGAADPGLSRAAGRSASPAPPAAPRRGRSRTPPTYPQTASSRLRSRGSRARSASG